MATIELSPTTRLPVQGLTEREVATRRERGEINDVELESTRTYWRILRENAFTFINILLFAIAILLVVLGLTGDAVVTAGLVLANVVTGVIQEGRAKRQLDRIALLTRPTATVIRDGKEQTIDPREIVLGDSLRLVAGDQVLVDGVLVHGGPIGMDEALLTGESDLVRKQLGEQVFSGTFCMTGSGVYEAQQVGASSVANQITVGARQFRQVKTPLQRDVGWVIRGAAILVVILSLLVADSFRSLYDRLPLVETVQAAAVIVALVPQGLYFMVTVTYAMAAVRMAGQGALIQRTNAVESISHVDMLCLDKTGTLTTNRLKLNALQPTEGSEEQLRACLGDFIASSTAQNRTAEAIAEACPGQRRATAQEIVFSSARKWSAVVFDDPMRQGLYVLGAPEMLQPHLAPGRDLMPQIDQWTAQGLRVMLFAHQPGTRRIDEVDGDARLPGNLQPLGLLSISDELRPEARTTITRFAEAGVSLKIISGDHPETVAALARQAGISNDAGVLSGLDLPDPSDERFVTLIEETTVFGRVTPQQKQQMVQSLRENGHYVAMIGDGVNDVLAMKQANVAIAMRSGNQATRSVADLVLLEDSFGVLPTSVMEGQRILRGMGDVMRIFLARTLSVMLVVFGTALLQVEFPITPKHNSILALLTVGVPALVLATWARPGVPPKGILRSAIHFVIPAALLIATLSLAVYMLYHSLSDDIVAARSALTTTAVFCGVILILFVEPPNQRWVGGDELSPDRRPVYLAGIMLILFVLTVAVPPIREFYELEVLDFFGYIVIGFAVVGWTFLLRTVWRMHPFEWLAATWRRFRKRRGRYAA